MRRAAAFVLGTLTGTSLLVGAKLATSSPQSVTAADDTGATVVVGKPGVTGHKSTAPPGAPHGTASPTGTGAPTGTPATHGTTTPSPTTTTAQPTPTPTSAGLADGAYKTSTSVGGGRHGTLSMTATISGGRITNIVASESNEPNCYKGVCPTLKSQALAAQSASIDGVSHATQTSDAYRTALQAVLNSAKG
jgi:uncharacterized protein with FMN-binding domain